MVEGDLWGSFDATVRRMGPRPAIVQGSRCVTFEQWQRRAQDYLAWFRAAGGRRFDRVIVSMDNSPEMAAALLGVWAAGGVCVLLNSSSPASLLEHVTRTVGPLCLLTDDHGKVPPVDAPLTLVRSGHVPVYSGSPHQPTRSLATDPASILFTSGSTGKPKGVTQSHGNLLRGCAAVASYTGLSAGDRLLCPIPWSFDYGYGQLLTTILTGAVHILPTAGNPFAVCEAITQHRPTVFAGLPSWYVYLFRGVSPFRQTDVSCLRTVMNTGGTIPRPVLEDMFQAFEHADIFLNYGLTESYRTTYLHPSKARRKPTSIGTGIPGVEVLVLREDDAVALPGEVGVIVHRGDYLFLGYWNDPEATASALRPDPLAPPGCPNLRRVLYTGDMGYMDDEGDLFYVGRKDQQLKSMGVRVSPGEVEEMLHASGLVREAAVFGRPHDLIGDEVCAAVVPLGGGPDAVKTIQAYCRRVMTPYMQPRQWLVKNGLPKTPSGKTDYAELKAEARELFVDSLSRLDRMSASDGHSSTHD